MKRYVDPQRMTFADLQVGDVYRYPGGLSQFVKVHQTTGRLERGLADDREYTENSWQEVIKVGESQS